MKKILSLLIFLSIAITSAARERVCFDGGWLFTLGDTPAMAQSDYNDSNWRSLNLPHDWAIEGNFACDNPS